MSFNIETDRDKQFVIIEFEVDSWSDISTGKTKALVFPRHLKE